MTLIVNANGSFKKLVLMFSLKNEQSLNLTYKPGLLKHKSL